MIRNLENPNISEMDDCHLGSQTASQTSLNDGRCTDTRTAHFVHHPVQSYFVDSEVLDELETVGEIVLRLDGVVRPFALLQLSRVTSGHDPEASNLELHRYVHTGNIHTVTTAMMTNR